MANALALVTGASSGIGKELARELASRDYDLVVASGGERLHGAADDLRAFGTEITEVQQDLATRRGVDALWQVVEANGRPLEVACLNAGVGVGGLFWETDLDAELNMVELNCVGTVQLAKYVVRHMVKHGRGRILFSSSIAGEMVAPREAVYAATKAFVLSLAHSIRHEVADKGVSVTALQPGPTNTDFFHRAGMDDTEVGQKGKLENSPRDVAREGIDALMDGKDHIYAASSMKTKLEGMVANAVPGAVKAAMHEKMARPQSERKAS
jgi:short-subunit dehydrogenase